MRSRVSFVAFLALITLVLTDAHAASTPVARNQPAWK